MAPGNKPASSDVELQPPPCVSDAQLDTVLEVDAEAGGNGRATCQAGNEAGTCGSGDQAPPHEERIGLLSGWRKESNSVSLEIANSSVKVPPPDAAWYRQWAAYIGVGFMVSVGYMDPGNWATNIQGGASFGYTLLIIILLASLTAMFLQYLALKLGVVAERDLAQACRDAYNPKVVWGLWIIAEVAIAATDLAEVIGSAVALNLLFHIPIWAGVLITAADVLFIIAFGIHSFRLMEILIIGLIGVITGCFAYELGAAKPDWSNVASGFIPKPKILTNRDILYAALGILGATVMPHNLFLHSSTVQTRAFPRNTPGKKIALRYGLLDSNLSLTFAFFINAAMLILAAAVFHFGAHPDTSVADITTAYELLKPAVGSVAPKLFAVGLLASGQQATITGTLAGQIVMEGFLNFKIAPWLRRLITRLAAIIPAVTVAAALGNAAVGKLLVLSQVILSITLSFAVIPLVQFTGTPKKMNDFRTPLWVVCIGGVIALIIAGLNVYLVIASIKDGDFVTATNA